MSAGRVVELWRYPVKSTAGERLDEAYVDGDGIAGDRTLGIRDRATGRIVSAKREPALLGVRAVLDGQRVTLVLPDGRALPVDDASDALSDLLGRAVVVARAQDADARPEIEDEDGTFRGRAGGRFFDSSPVHIVTTGTLALLATRYPAGIFDRRRFRPNLVVEAGDAQPVEQGWIDRVVTVGSVRMRIAKPCRRCVMTTAAQDGLPHDRGILRTVAREQANIVGVYARVEEPGRVAVGDEVVV